ncbi:MAG: AsmA family protein [Rickettsiales bacterium]|jgi:hypothetical protein|nr:AsmA family protein [Rickettsiales bacterium]
MKILQRQRKKKALIHWARIVCMLAAGFAVAAIVAVSQLDINTLKKDIASTLAAATGLPVEITGKLSWKLSLRPRVVINDVRIAGAKWAHHKYPIQIPQMQVQLNLVSLLRRTAAIQSVRLTNPKVNIEKNAKGQISLAARGADGHAERAGHAVPFPFNLDLGIGAIELDRPQIFYITPDGVESFTPDFVKIVMQEKSEESIAFSGAVSDEGGSYPFLVSFGALAGGQYPANISIAGDVMPMSASITLDKNLRPASFDASGRLLRAEKIGRSFGLDFPKIARADFSISAAMNGKILSLKKAALRGGGTDISINGKYDTALGRFDLHIKSGAIDLARFFPNLYGGDYFWRHPPRPLNVFKDIPLYGRLLDAASGSAEITIGKLLVYRDLAITDSGVKLGIENGRLDARVGAGFAGGDVFARVTARHIGSDILAVKAGGFGTDIGVGNLLEMVREKDFISELPTNFDFYIEGAGANLSDMTKSANGPVRIVSNAGGYAHEDLLDYIYGRDFITGVRESVQGLFARKSRAHQMKIKCAVANLMVRRGAVALERNVAAQTEQINILLVGNVDFGNERMSLRMDTKPLEGIRLSLSGAAANTMEFGGNLAEPDLRIGGAALAEDAAAVGAGAAVGAVLGPVGAGVGAGVGWLGSKILGAWLADETPCRTALGSGAPSSHRRDPEFMKHDPAELAREFLK